MSSCRSGEAGGEREAAAGERSLHEIEICDVRGGCIVRVGMGLGRRVQHAARSVLMCAAVQRVQHTKTSVDTAVCYRCLYVQVGETTTRLPTTIILSHAMLLESLPQISPDYVAVALFALASSDVAWQPDS